MCRFRRSFRPKVIPQTIQAKGCSPVCLNMWTRKWSERKNRWSHRSHLNGRTFTRNYVIIFVIFFISGAYEIKIYSFWPKFRFLTKISIFDQNFDFWPKCLFLSTISIVDQNLDFWTKIFIFDQNVILVQNWDSWSKFQFFTSIF